MTDRVHGIGFTYYCHVGFGDEERSARQRLVIDWEVETDWRVAARLDRAKDIVDYNIANNLIGELVQGKAYRLIEAVAEDVAHLLLRSFPVTAARVKVTKTPFHMPNVVGVAVECERTIEDYA